METVYTFNGETVPGFWAQAGRHRRGRPAVPGIRLAGMGRIGLPPAVEASARRMASARTELRAQATSGPMPRLIRRTHATGCMLQYRQALPPQALQTYELRQNCPDIAGGGTCLKQREGEKQEWIRAGRCPHGASRSRATKAALRAAREPAQHLGRNWMPTVASALSGGSGGSSPRANTASRWRGPERAEHRATPGGYGGKPPGVASSAFRRGPGTPAGAPTGDQSTG
jgi:hypothetical protein